MYAILLNSNHLSLPLPPKHNQVSTVQTIAAFSAEEMLRGGLCSEDLRDSAWNVSETTTIPQCLPLRLGGAELS